MAKAPGARGFTIQEVRALSIERRTFHLTWVVALFAATMSFTALQWVGVQMGMYVLIAPLLPLAIDGLGIICSFGIIRSAAAKEPFRNRASEWAGLGLSLGLSMAGNAAHALETVPWWLKVTYSVAVPVIVAYSIHVLGRYMDSGVSAYVLADDPDRVHFDLPQVGEQRALTPRTPRATAAPAPRATPAPDATAARSVPAPTRARGARHDQNREGVFEKYRSRLAEGVRMDGNEIGELLGLHPGRARSLRKEWDTRIAELNLATPDRDPITEQITPNAATPTRASA